jgi:OOP family OmpA-OmpF porin
MRAPALAFSLSCLAAPAFAQPADGQPFRVFFDWGKPELTRDAQAILDDAAAAYQRLKPGQIAVTGFADRSGSEPVNRTASRRRAEAVKAYLIAHGIPPATIHIAAYGERQPIVPTEDGVREAQNRRVEIAFSR